MNAGAALVVGVLCGAAVWWVADRVAAGSDAADLVADAENETRDFIDRITDKDIDMNDANLNAFLRMIRTAEGTADAAGYRRIFGGALFEGFADHPRRKVTATFKNGKTVTSTAAGAYQFLASTWDEARAALKLPDFSPASQDAAAAWLIRRRGALADVRGGRLAAALAKCAKEWASLPGSPYGQPTITDARARELFAAAGGTEETTA